MPTLREQLMPTLNLQRQPGTGEIYSRPRTLRDILAPFGRQAQTAGELTGLDSAAEDMRALIQGRGGLSNILMLGAAGLPAIRGPLRGILRKRPKVVEALKPKGIGAGELGELDDFTRRHLKLQGLDDAQISHGMNLMRPFDINSREGVLGATKALEDAGYNSTHSMMFVHGMVQTMIRKPKKSLRKSDVIDLEVEE